MKKAALLLSFLTSLLAPTSAFAAGASQSATSSALPSSGSTNLTILIASVAFFLIFLGIARLAAQKH